MKNTKFITNVESSAHKVKRPACRMSDESVNKLWAKTKFIVNFVIHVFMNTCQKILLLCSK